ncbi:U-box domain-containing protein 33-like [Fagus crenata]
MDSIENGIVELISQHGMRELVMGAAADKYYSKKSMVLKSRKAIYVCLQAPISCHIKFFCKDQKFGGSRTDVLYVKGSTDEGVGFSCISSPGSSYSTCPSHQVVDIGLIPSVRTKVGENGLKLRSHPESKENLNHLSPLSVLVRRIDDTLYTQLEQAMAEAKMQGVKHFKRLRKQLKTLIHLRNLGMGDIGAFIKVSCVTQVAIKMLLHHSVQEPFRLQREVEILSKLRHPNLVTLIGSCQEACALIYDYLPNGSLEDQLRCKDKTPPLSWKTRISIATGLCRVLIFLHSSQPIGIIHGDLTPANILFDANFVSKLSDFGICHLLPHDQSSRNTALGTFAYMDPEFLSTGELTLKSDVYSFGIILLQLLTGRPALRITKDVKYALDFGTLKELLDPLAGDWPFKQAEKLAYLALRCCNPKQKSRPDLVSEVLTVLEPIGTSCGGSSSIRLGSEENCEPPLYLICPISHEVMHDPLVAADGYTYEAEALREWLESGHDTSPMTNIKLEHFNLVPNHALRSAIQEWRKKH